MGQSIEGKESLFWLVPLCWRGQETRELYRMDAIPRTRRQCWSAAEGRSGLYEGTRRTGRRGCQYRGQRLPAYLVRNVLSRRFKRPTTRTKAKGRAAGPAYAMSCCALPPLPASRTTTIAENSGDACSARGENPTSLESCPGWLSLRHFETTAGCRRARLLRILIPTLRGL
jgi:hypothetical protein